MAQTDFMARYQRPTRISGTVTFPQTTVVCSKQTSAVLAIYSNSGIYILELYIHTYIDNLYLNPLSSFVDTALTKTRCNILKTTSCRTLKGFTTIQNLTEVHSKIH